MNTLVTFLGRTRGDRETGYEKTVYRMPDGQMTKETAFFGLALSGWLDVDAIVILGTSGSQWGVLVENLAAEGDEEEFRVNLMEAEDKATVDQTVLDELAPLMGRSVGRTVIPRIIPFGQEADEQYDILATIADAVPEGAVSIDLTHGFRHLGMIGFLCAFMLERVRNLIVLDLWYGALDMRQENVTPVLKLDGLVRVRRWVDALDRFDATGDYGVFAQLLIADGVAEDKANCLKLAAFYERTLNVSDAARQLGTFRPVLAEPLRGASGLFRDKLDERLRWAELSDPWKQQRQLAYQYLNRRDHVRAAMLAREAWVSRLCSERDGGTVDYRHRKAVVDEFESSLKSGGHDKSLESAYWKLTHIRNALAHATEPEWREIQGLLKKPDRLHQALEAACRRLLG